MPAGVLWAVAAATSYSLSAVVGKDLLEHLGTASLLFWRFGIATVVLFASLAIRSRTRRRAGGRRAPGAVAVAEAPVPHGRLLALGVAFGIVVLVGFLGLDRLDASVQIVLVYLYPVFVVVGAGLIGATPARGTWVAVVLVVIGVLLTVPELFIGGGGPDISPVGVVLSLAQAVLFAAYLLVNSRVTPSIDGLTVSAWTLLGAAAFIMPVALASGLVVPRGTVLVLEVLLFALVPTVIATVCLFAALRHLGPAVVAMILPLEVVLAITWSVLFLGERVGVVEALGAVVVIAAIVLAQWLDSRADAGDAVVSRRRRTTASTPPASSA